METQQIEITKKETTMEAFFAELKESLEAEEEKLKRMDGDKAVSKEEYKKIQEQAKLVEFLRAIKKPATLYAEAVENNSTELQTIMKKYLNV
jgi:hypothetical protein